MIDRLVIHLSKFAVSAALYVGSITAGHSENINGTCYNNVKDLGNIYIRDGSEGDNKSGAYGKPGSGPKNMEGIIFSEPKCANNSCKLTIRGGIEDKVIFYINYENLETRFCRRFGYEIINNEKDSKSKYSRVYVHNVISYPISKPASMRKTIHLSLIYELKNDRVSRVEIEDDNGPNEYPGFSVEYKDYAGPLTSKIILEVLTPRNPGYKDDKLLIDVEQ